VLVAWLVDVVAWLVDVVAWLENICRLAGSDVSPS